MASGMPSSRWQIRPMARLPSASTNSDGCARTPARRIAGTPRPVSRGAVEWPVQDRARRATARRHVTSPGTAERLTARRQHRHGRVRSQDSATSSAQSSTRCSQLSSASSDGSSPSAAASCTAPGTSGASAAWSTASAARATPRRPSPLPARPTTRLRETLHRCGGDGEGDPVLPTPPAPVIVTSRSAPDEPSDLADVGTTTDQRCQLRGQVVTERGQGAQVRGLGRKPVGVSCQTCSGARDRGGDGSPGPRASCRQAAGSRRAGVDAETRI